MPRGAGCYGRLSKILNLLNDSEHVLTNPAARLASQGGTVDWMRFWLQDYEDPAAAKTEQYKLLARTAKNSAGTEVKFSEFDCRFAAIELTDCAASVT